MHGHPTQGVKGAKAPKPENGKPRLSSRPGPRIAQLSEEYLETRNRQMAAKAFMAETEAAQRRGELISRKLVGMQAAYLLTPFVRDAFLSPRSSPTGWPARRLSTPARSTTFRKQFANVSMRCSEIWPTCR